MLLQIVPSLLNTLKFLVTERKRGKKKYTQQYPMHSDADTDFQHTQIHILTFNVQHLRANLKVFGEIPIV